MTDIEKVQELVKQSGTITFFTGAGMSTESGLPDFRSSNGLYKQNMNFTDIVSLDFYEKDPVLFWTLFKDIFRIRMLHNYVPNKGYHYISKLQEKGKHIRVITQNIDGLHYDSGHEPIYEIHGTIKKAHCRSCYREYDLEYLNEHDCPRCKECGEILKPNVVLFGDPIQQFEEAVRDALHSDLFFVLGSSLEVGPVNQIPLIVKEHTDAKLIIINREETRFDSLFDYVFHMNISDAFQHILGPLHNV
ncbi:NAD-dependent protein deacylase [Priestia endophytica]|uniref:NAD-dependent protein deacylase n=1 Tax=Priestia endophytica TaxID=135735 RepID=UPI002E1EA792|nr:NAD-dependent protein deacylase [Priestia endophytica]